MKNDEILDLFLKVVPERKDEVESIWANYEPAYELVTDRAEFVLDTSPFGFIRYTHRTKLKIYLLGWVLWRETYCWSTFIWELATQSRPFIQSEFEASDGQNEAYTAADTLYAEALAFIDAESINWDGWPSKVPQPREIASASKEDWFIKDLVEQAIALFFLHELRHFMLAKDKVVFTDPIDEEFECDRWATDYLLDRSDSYANSNGQDRILVKSTRAMGIALGKTVMAHVQAIGLWQPGKEHPRLAKRIERLAQRVELPLDDFFWNMATSFLLACLRRQNRLPDRLDFNDPRELFTKLLVLT